MVAPAPGAPRAELGVDADPEGMDGTETRRDRASAQPLTPGTRAVSKTQQVSWLPDRSPADPSRLSPVVCPPSSPDTVAGAAPAFHRLPCWPRRMGHGPFASTASRSQPRTDGSAAASELTRRLLRFSS